MRRPDRWDAAVARDLIESNAKLDGATLPILHALQDQFGYVDPAAEPMIADALNLSLAELRGVISFYHDFREQPAGRHVLKLCRAEACQSMNGEALARQALDRFGIDWGGTTPDGRLTVEATYCLGLCSCAPSAMRVTRVLRLTL